MSPRSNEEWLFLLKQSDTVALTELREYLFRAAFVYLRDKRTDLTDFALDDLRAMAHDFAQEALVSILRKLETYRGDARFTTWAYRFVINRAADALRRRRYQDLVFSQLPEQEAAALMAVAQATADPIRRAEQEALLQLLLQFIESELNQRQRLALLGVHFQERSIQEVAEALDCSPNTVYKMLYDARQKIKRKLLAEAWGLGDVLALFDDG